LKWYPTIKSGSCPSVGYNKKVAWTNAGQTYNDTAIKYGLYSDAQLYVKDSSATSKATAAPAQSSTFTKCSGGGVSFTGEKGCYENCQNGVYFLRTTGCPSKTAAVPTGTN